MTNNTTREVFEYLYDNCCHLRKEDKIIISAIINAGIYDALSNSAKYLDEPEFYRMDGYDKYKYYMCVGKDEDGLYTVPESPWIPKDIQGRKVDNRIIEWCQVD